MDYNQAERLINAVKEQTNFLKSIETLLVDILIELRGKPEEEEES